MKPQVVARDWESGYRGMQLFPGFGTITSWFARHIPAKTRAEVFAVWKSGDDGEWLAVYVDRGPGGVSGRSALGLWETEGFAMLMAEFSTAVKYKLPIKIVVVNNNSLGQIKWEQMVFLGNPEYVCDVTPIDFAAFARRAEARIHDYRSERLRRILDQALATRGPVIIDAIVDPHEPPMPRRSQWTKPSNLPRHWHADAEP